MKKPLSSELLDKYLNGACSLKEREEVENWYQAFEDTQDINTLFPEVQNESYSQSIFAQIRSQIKSKETDNKNSLKLLDAKQWYWYLAASVLIGIGVSFLFKKNNSSFESKSALAGPTTFFLENKTNKIQQRQLPDSSKVWLNPGSRISYNNNYGTKVREINLEGEAFFDVTRNTSKPFIIHTGKMTTEVLGTSFNVQARKNSKHFEVSVVTGTVSVSGPDGKEIIKARQQVQFDPTSGKLNQLKRTTIAPFQIWEPVTINFDWVTVHDVTNRLQEMFAVQVEFENDAIKNCFLRADFTNMRLPVIMDLLCQSIGATYTIDNGKIRLYGVGCD
ncbi:FecR family protein [Dyadobacter frigoris]|uniref:FecR family protein n=1 Tax=Dyadobacter frigoris TaxID=2576211 RepID=A0A4U6D1N2_9BACT|nr:FecR family protein [Dyadobacter frigoris]TKT89728.1 FecR family protein [Dyadobacter frigoris]GLU54043.1 anti-sigma factor [Dyadobacter frigoris]